MFKVSLAKSLPIFLNKFNEYFILGKENTIFFRHLLCVDTGCLNAALVVHPDAMRYFTDTLPLYVSRKMVTNINA